MKEAIVKAAAAAVFGTAFGTLAGWTTSALTLTGRVTAIEQSLVRIEAHLDRVDADRIARK